MVFYITLITLLSLTTGLIAVDEGLIKFPEYPDFNPIDEPPPIAGGVFLSFLLGTGTGVIEFSAFIIIIFVFLVNLTLFTMPTLLPAWLNTIIFLPIGVFIVYEALARLGRGS